MIPVKSPHPSGPPSGFGKPFDASPTVYALIGFVIVPAFAFFLTGTMRTLGVYVLPVFILVVAVWWWKSERPRTMREEARRVQRMEGEGEKQGRRSEAA